MLIMEKVNPKTKAKLPECMNINTPEELDAFLERRVKKQSEMGVFYTEEEFIQKLNSSLGVVLK